MHAVKKYKTSFTPNPKPLIISHCELGWFVLLPVTKTISLNWDTEPLLLPPLFCPFAGPEVKILILSAVTNSCGSGFKREYAEECPGCGWQGDTEV